LIGLIFGGKGKGWMLKMEMEKRIFCNGVLSIDWASLATLRSTFWCLLVGSELISYF